MTERQKTLLKDYGPRFIKRSTDILNETLHLAADAYSVMPEEEWTEAARTMDEFKEQLYKVRNTVARRLEEAGIEY